MLRNNFDLNKPHRAVLYLRMSSDRQNPRSPDQQDATIRSTVKRLGFPWSIVQTYRDDAISGKPTLPFCQIHACTTTSTITLPFVPGGGMGVEMPTGRLGFLQGSK